MVVPALGLIGSVAFALSATPQLVKVLRDGHARGVSAGTLALWVVGEIAMIGYTIGALHCDPFLLANYGCNLAILLVICWRKVCPANARLLLS